MKTARLQLRIDKELKDAAEKAAQKRGRSLSFLVSEFLELMVKQEREVTMDDNGVRQI